MDRGNTKQAVLEAALELFSMQGFEATSISQITKAVGMSDEHDLVQKGYGWMLKSLSQVDMETVTNYLIDNHTQMPRTAYRYALEKYDQMKAMADKRNKDQWGSK